MAEGPNGTIFVGTRAIGRVYAVTRNPDGTTRTRTIAQGLTQPNGLVVIGNSLYVLAVNRVLRYDNIEANLDNVPAPVELTRPSACRATPSMPATIPGSSRRSDRMAGSI